MYVRSDNGMKFGRVIRVHTLIRKTWSELDNGERIDVLELTKNKIRDKIIDLIEEGDYVNGCRIYRVGNCLTIILNDEENISWINPDEIKSIVTREQFEQMAYKVSL